MNFQVVRNEFSTFLNEQGYAFYEDNRKNDFSEDIIRLRQ